MCFNICTIHNTGQNILSNNVATSIVNWIWWFFLFVNRSTYIPEWRSLLIVSFILYLWLISSTVYRPLLFKPSTHVFWGLPMALAAYLDLQSRILRFHLFSSYLATRPAHLHFIYATSWFYDVSNFRFMSYIKTSWVKGLFDALYLAERIHDNMTDGGVLGFKISASFWGFRCFLR